MKQIIRKKMKQDWGEVFEVFLTSISVIGAMLIGGFALGYFGSKIWLHGTVSDFTVLASLFEGKMDVNVACGIIASATTFYVIGSKFVIKEIKRRKR